MKATLDRATREDIAYLAGLYEGEGTVIGGRERVWRRMSIRMTDPEPLQRMFEVFGGKFRGPYQSPSERRPEWKPKYEWVLNSWHDMRVIGDAIRPMLSPRRQAQWDAAMDGCPDLPRGFLACPKRPYPNDRGALRHLFLGIPICKVCEESRRLLILARNDRLAGSPQKRRPKHAGKHSGPRASTILVCDQPIEASILGYARHRALGVPLCERCSTCRTLYGREAKARRAASDHSRSSP